MELPEIFKATEFVAAMAGVVAGFCFTMGADGIRFIIKKSNRKKMLDEEVLLARHEAVIAVNQYSKNHQIPLPSSQSPVFLPAHENEIIADKLLQLEAGLDIDKRRCLRVLSGFYSRIKGEVEKLNECLFSEDKRQKIFWERHNTNLTHYYAFIIYKCDEYFGKASSFPIAALDTDISHSQNEETLRYVEKKLDIQLPRNQ